MTQLSGIVTCYSSRIHSEHNIDVNCYIPICIIYIKAFIWYFQIADPFPLLIVKTHFLIS